jgi:mannose-6-phosphate isomerase
MFVRIDNTPRDYAWGSTTDIAQLLGRSPSGAPEAELWLGAHPGSPSRILDPGQASGAENLADWIAQDPVTALGADEPSAEDPRLSFLLKVLAADSHLSLQAHPSPEQALAGFERENALGIPIDAPERNYRDPFHKPELIYALSDPFEALCGFRPVAESLADVDRLIEAARSGGRPHRALSALRDELGAAADDAAVLRGAVRRLLDGGDDVGELIAEIAASAADADPTPSIATVGALTAQLPDDPGAVLALLLGRVTLERGQVLYLPAGNIHAYLKGLGVELMAASDNVLRGGLTPKHVDVDELLGILDFRPLPAPLLEPREAAPGVEVFSPDIEDFQLVHVIATGGGSPRIELAGPAIALCIDGELGLSGSISALTLSRGESAYITPDELSLAVAGAGELFVATPNL